MTVDLSSLTTRDLLRIWAGALRELRARDVVRTVNNPISDIAEQLVALHYGGERASFTQPGWDVLGPAGERLQVKALRLAGQRARRNLSVIRSSDYDAVVAVVFDEEIRVIEALWIPRGAVEELFPHRAHVNGRIITLTAKLRADPRVRSIALTDAWLDTMAPLQVSDADAAAVAP